MTDKNRKVIFDTNVWISFLIGKRLTTIQKYISNSQITIFTIQQLLTEIKEVTGREKLKKYFPQQSVTDLLDLLNIVAVKFEITPTHFLNRNPKDNFLLDLIDFSKADYLVTGDKDLLLDNSFNTATILTPADFEKVMTTE